MMRSLFLMISIILLCCLHDGHSFLVQKKTDSTCNSAARMLGRLALSHKDPSCEKKGTHEAKNTPSSTSSPSRRAFFQQGSLVATGLLTGSSSMNTIQPAAARGLVAFPCTPDVYPLHNTYHLMRAGTSLMEEQDIISTNPLFLTNLESALSDTGRDQVHQAAQKLALHNVNPSVIKFSLAASAMDTTALVRDELQVGQNRCVPEFTFMDPRGVGKWDMMSYAQVYPAVVALDEAQAGPEGRGGRPPINDDGTAHETLFDQSIRLRQLMSILETQYSGDTILLVFPDGTSPALLSAMIAGVPYNECHELDYAQGEVRIDVNVQSTLDLLASKRAAGNDDYVAVVKKGKAELKTLQAMDTKTMVSKKDVMIETQRVEVEEEYLRQKEVRLQKEEAIKEAKLERQREIEEVRIARHQQKEAKLRRKQTEATALYSSGRETTAAGDGDLQTWVAAGGAVVSGTVLMAAAGMASATKNQPETNAEAAPLPEPAAPPNATNVSNATTDDAVEDGGLDPEREYEPRMVVPRDDDVLLRRWVPDPVQDKWDTTTPEVKLPPPIFELKPVLTEDELKEEADTAMKEYMDQDDGGDAWLQSLGDIIMEDEGEGDDPFLFPVEDDDLELLRQEITQNQTREAEEKKKRGTIETEDQQNA